MIDRPRIAIAAGAGVALILLLIFVASPDKRPAPTQSKDAKKSSTEDEKNAAGSGSSRNEDQRWQPVSSQELKNTEKSIALTLMVSNESVEVVGSLRRSIPFRFDQMRAGVFRIEVADSQKRVLSIPMELPGLLPQSQAALADENGELTMGDEVFSLKIPVIVVVPDMPTPFTVTIKRPDGSVMGASEIANVINKKAP
ncbi:MAG: hypothetical protein P1V97_35715 [Planctomycetota bacterium]|nr:hypothetical protein [Planctomycetota bacterium]